jgi:hypothetical protein
MENNIYVKYAFVAVAEEVRRGFFRYCPDVLYVFEGPGRLSKNHTGPPRDDPGRAERIIVPDKKKLGLRDIQP